VSNSRTHVLIAGAGIGGLSAALALLQRGFEVDVYEQAPKLEEVGAGVQLSPNGNRALAARGVLEQLAEVSCTAEGKEIRHGKPARPGSSSTSGPKRPSATAFLI
jgi:salicylate hydroxylase